MTVALLKRKDIKTVEKVGIERDTIIDIQNEVINTSIYIGGINACIDELFEIKHSIECDTERTKGNTLPPCFYSTMGKFENYLTLIELSHTKLKESNNRLGKLAQGL